MTADTQAQGDLMVALAQQCGAYPVLGGSILGFTPDALEAFAAALQGREQERPNTAGGAFFKQASAFGTQEGEPSHLDLCASQDDTMANHPHCDCAAASDPYREHLAQQAENIGQEPLQRALTLMGSAHAGSGQEGFSARLAENVNRLTLAINMHFRNPAPLPAGLLEGEPSDAVDAARYRFLRERNAVLDSCPIFTAIRTAGPDGKFAGNDLIAGDEMDAAVDECRAALAQGDAARAGGEG